MWLRRAFFRWLIPAAFVMPLWLLIGWAIFSASGWAFLGTLFIAIPAVFVGQLVLTLLVRSRPSVRADRAVSWPDVIGFSIWHALLIVFGCYLQGVFFAVLMLTIVAFLALFWMTLTQLWSQAKAKIETFTVVPPVSAAPAGSTASVDPQRAEVFIVTETTLPPEARETR